MNGESEREENHLSHFYFTGKLSRKPPAPLSCKLCMCQKAYLKPSLHLLLISPSVSSSRTTFWRLMSGKLLTFSSKESALPFHSFPLYPSVHECFCKWKLRMVSNTKVKMIPKLYIASLNIISSSVRYKKQMRVRGSERNGRLHRMEKVTMMREPEGEQQKWFRKWFTTS